MASKTWSRIADLHVGRFQAAVIAFHDRLWAVGGFNGKDFLKTVEFLDHNSEEWTNILTIDEKTDARNTLEGVESIEKTVDTLVIMGDDNREENFMEKQIEETSKNDEN